MSIKATRNLAVVCSLFLAPAALASGISASSDASPSTERVTLDAQLTDNQIVAVLATADLGELRMAQMALRRSENNEVRAYALTLLQDHSRSTRDNLVVSFRNALFPMASDLSRSLMEHSQSAMSNLQGFRGSDFDRLFVESAVMMHRMVLDAIDRELLPASSRDDLRSFVGEMRPVIARHLEMAMELQASLASSN